MKKKTAQKRWPLSLLECYRSCQLALLVPVALILAKAGGIVLLWSGGAALTLLRHLLVASHIWPLR
ncbi:MAG: hypothetical protein V4724_29725 [Pseudomonadota bacterium]